MAYNPYSDEEDDLLGQGTTGASATSTPAPAAGPVTTTNPSSSNRFVNFSSYFNANPAAQMGANFANDLEGKATGAQASGANARQDVTNRAAAATIQGPPSSYGPWAEHAEAGSGTAAARAAQQYAGPKDEDVYGAFDPIMKQASTAQRNIATAQDPSGVQAVRGGTGFDAALTSAGAGGRKAELKQKYGNLFKGVEADRRAAWDASQKAQADSAAATGAWGAKAGEIEEYDRNEATRAAEVQKATDRKTTIDNFKSKLPNDNRLRDAFGQMTPEEQDAFMALNPTDSMYGYRVNQAVNSAEAHRRSEQLFNQMSNAPTFGNIIRRMSPEEVAKLKTLDPANPVQAAAIRELLTKWRP